MWAGKIKKGKSQNRHFSGNKSPGKYTCYTVLVNLYIEVSLREQRARAPLSIEIDPNDPY